jgi:hypothetical protein
MSKLNVEELVSGLLEAGMVAQRIAERQHISIMINYFSADGTPKTQTFKIGEKDMEVPLFILADHSSIGLDELDIEFEARLIFGDNHASELKRSLLGIFKTKDGKVSKDSNHNIKSIEVDSGKHDDSSGLAKIKVKFKSDTKPEMISRLIDSYIQRLEDTSTNT